MSNKVFKELWKYYMGIVDSQLFRGKYSRKWIRKNKKKLQAISRNLFLCLEDFRPKITYYYESKEEKRTLENKISQTFPGMSTDIFTLEEKKL